MLIGRKTIGSVVYMGGVMSIPEPFVRSWQQMIEFNSEYLVSQDERILYDRATVSYHSFARNSLIDQMRGEWIIMFDTDVTFDPDIVLRMLNKANKFDVDVLCAPYLYKMEPHPPVLYGYDKEDKRDFILADWDRKADLIPIKAAGAGCLFIRKNVIDKIKATGQAPFDIYMDKQRGPLSEDHSFFQRCWELKIPIYAASDIFVNHLIYKPLNVLKDYNPTKEMISKKKIIKYW